MAVSGTVPARRPNGADPMRYARWVRRSTFVAAVVTFGWFFLRFGTEWVPVGMDTVPGLAPNSWCVVDRWSRGLRVGSDVFYEGPLGLMLGRVSALDSATFAVQNVDPRSRVPDSATFGSLPRTALRGTVVVALPPGQESSRGR